VRVTGRTVVVTGASSGIGAAAARAFAAKRARVVLMARSADKLEAVAADIAARGGEARPWALDCGDREAVARAAAAFEAELGAPDVLVNCAGAGHAYFFDETPPSEFERMMAAPFFSAAYLTRAFLPAMIQRGSGYVVNVGSPIAYVTWPGAAGYAAVRWAMRGLAAVLDAELRGTGVRSVNVVPGTVASGYFEHNPGFEERIPKIARLTGTLTPERVGEAIVQAVERDRREVFVPPMLGALVVLSRVFPRLVSTVVVKTGAKRAPVEVQAASAEAEGTPG
jgi:short-subunit dehydrogenase